MSARRSPTDQYFLFQNACIKNSFFLPSNIFEVFQEFAFHLVTSLDYEFQITSLN